MHRDVCLWHIPEVPSAAFDGRLQFKADAGKPSNGVFMSSRPS